jgi:hypothetical protein
MSLKWIVIAMAVAALAAFLWASDRITYEGERTVYTVRCEQGAWEGLTCHGTMVAGERYRFRASTSKREVLYWTVGSSDPSGKYSNCNVKDRGNWSCELIAGQPSTITRQMINGRPVRDADHVAVPFHAVPKWVWWVLHSGAHVYSKAGY